MSLFPRLPAVVPNTVHLAFGEFRIGTIKDGTLLIRSEQMTRGVTLVKSIPISVGVVHMRGCRWLRVIVMEVDGKKNSLEQCEGINYNPTHRDK